MRTFDRLSEAIRWLEQNGLRVVIGGTGHYKVYYRERMVANLSKNMNDARGWKNNLAKIRRRTGLELR